MSGNGWISLHRSIQNHWLFTEKRKFSKFEAWVDLLLLMNHADAKTLFREELIHIKRGQHVTSIRKLSDRWGWSRTKTENFLSLLESENMIQFEKASNKTLVTVVNYDSYQSDNLRKSQYQNENENKIPEKRATEEPDLTQENQGVSEIDNQKESHGKATEKPVKSPNNNVNNENNANKTINKKSNVEANASDVIDKQVQDVWNHYLQTFDGFFSRLTLTATRKKAIKARLQDKHPEKKGELLFSVDDIKQAISNIRQSTFHCGNNPNNKFYAHIEFVCRNADMVEKWVNETPKQQQQKVIPFNKQGGNNNATNNNVYGGHSSEIGKDESTSEGTGYYDQFDGLFAN